MCSWANNNPFPIDASLDPQIVSKPCWQRCWKIHPRRRKGWIPSPSPYTLGRPGSPPRPRAAFPAHAYSTKFSTVPILTMLGAATINKHGTKLMASLRRSILWPPKLTDHQLQGWPHPSQNHNLARYECGSASAFRAVVPGLHLHFHGQGV